MIEIYTPFDSKKLAELPLNSGQDLEQMLVVAHHLASNKKELLAAHQRIKILENAKELMKIRKEELIQTACQEGGKPLMDTQVEVERAIGGIQLAVNAIHDLNGKNVPMGLTASTTNRLAFSYQEPIGVVAAISAFNHPINLIVHQVITAIAAGCPVIVKPALTTPLSCLLVVEILKQAGLPELYCQVLIGDNALAEQLATDSRIAFLSFIGSAKVGWYLRSKLAPGTRCALEHGGVAPVIAEKDADLKALIPSVIKGAFYHAGQVCVSTQRLFVHEQIVNEVTGALAEKARDLVVGNPLNEATEIGPLISEEAIERVHQWVQEAIQEGANIVGGGKKLSDSCYAPTILLNPAKASKVSQLEIFGPVLCVYSYKNLDDAIAQANDLNYHFQAAVYTRNINTALKASKNLNASSVMINDHTAFRADWMPFGGRNESGLGMGGISQSIKDMSAEKLIVVKSDDL